MRPKINIPAFVPPEVTPAASNHPGGDAFFKNNVSVVTPEYDANVQTGRAAALGATNDLPIPIHHTLGANVITTMDSALTNADETTTYANLGLTSFDIAVTVAGTSVINPVHGCLAGMVAGTYVLVFDASSVTGSPQINSVYNGSAYVDVNYDIVEGENTIEIDCVADYSSILVRYNGTQTFSMSVTNYELKQITNPNSFLTYHDIANNEVIQLGNAVDGGSSKELYELDFVAMESTGGNITVETATSFSIDGVGGKFTRKIDDIEIGREIRIEYDIDVTVTSAIKDADPTAGNDIITLSVGNNTGVAIYTALNGGLYFRLSGAGDIAVNTFNVTEILPTSTEYTFNDVTLNNILTHKMPFSAGDLGLIQAEPNLLGALALGEATPISSVTLDATDSWYAVSEESGAYVVDQRAGYGVNVVVNGTFDTDLSGWVNNGCTWDVSQRCHLVSDGTNVLIQQNGILDRTKVNVITLDVEISLGELDVIATSETLLTITESGSYTITVPIGSVTQNDLVLKRGYDTAGIPTDCYIDNVSVREATASEISGDITNVRINQQSIGLQTTALELDGAGVPTAYNSVANTAKVYSDSIINTGFKPAIARYSIDETVSGELQDFGDNVLVNPDFSGGATGWTITGNWAIGTSAILTSSAGLAEYLYQASVEVGKTYLFSVYVTSLEKNGGFGINLLPDGTNRDPDWELQLGWNAIVATSTQTNIFIAPNTTGVSCEVTYFSAQELTTKTQRTERRVLTHTDAKLGDDLVTNGTFDSTIVPWDTYSNQATLSWDATEKLKCVYNSSDGAVEDVSVNIELGKTYRISVDITGDIGSSQRAYVGGLSGTDSVLLENTSGDTYSGIATATSSAARGLYLSNAGLNSGDIFFYDNIVVREVSTESKYYIGVDGGAMVEQTVVPPLPDPALTINLNDTAVIGYPDTVDTRLADFEVHSEVIIP